MPSRGPGSVVFDDAIEMLREAERLHRQFFRFGLGRPASCWEPPVDIVEHEEALVIRVALPGVAAEGVQVATDGRSLRVLGVRSLPASAGDTIHRIEIPHGRFERAIELPPGRYELVQRAMAEGCLVLTLRRLA